MKYLGSSSPRSPSDYIKSNKKSVCTVVTLNGVNVYRTEQNNKFRDVILSLTSGFGTVKQIAAVCYHKLYESNVGTFLLLNNMLQISKSSTVSLKYTCQNTTRTHLEIMDSVCRLHKKLNCADQGHSLHILERLISKRREDGPAQSASENGTKPYDARWRRKMEVQEQCCRRIKNAWGLHGGECPK